VQTAEDLDVFAFRYDRGHTVALSANLLADRRDAELMYMLTDEAPGAARHLLSGLASEAEQKAHEKAAHSAYWSGRL
jgi:hypothetical protein